MQQIETRFNAVAILDPDGNEAGHYQKRKQEAFGEYTPLITDLPGLNNLVRDSFGDFTNEISVGKTPSNFPAGKHRITPLVCFK